MDWPSTISNKYATFASRSLILDSGVLPLREEESGICTSLVGAGIFLKLVIGIRLFLKVIIEVGSFLGVINVDSLGMTHLRGDLPLAWSFPFSRADYRCPIFSLSLST
jgi:hypothetical protein